MCNNKPNFKIIILSKKSDTKSVSYIIPLKQISRKFQNKVDQQWHGDMVWGRAGGKDYIRVQGNFVWERICSPSPLQFHDCIPMFKLIKLHDFNMCSSLNVKIIEKKRIMVNDAGSSNI